jgi:hypothetical protein
MHRLNFHSLSGPERCCKGTLQKCGCNHVDVINTQELKQHVELVEGFHDTPLLYLALKRTPGNLDKVYFEGDLGQVTIGLNRHFAQVGQTVLASLTALLCAGRLAGWCRIRTGCAANHYVDTMCMCR